MSRPGILAFFLFVYQLSTCAATQAEPLYKTWHRSVFFHSLGRQVGGAARAYAETLGHTANANAVMANARRDFWAEYSNGIKDGPAAERFAKLLWEKDIICLRFALFEGPNARTEAAYTLLLGKVDKGIPEGARKAYNRWVQALREELGANNRGEQVLASPERLLQAMDSTYGVYEHYQIIRNWCEFRKAGREDEFYGGDEGYLAYWLLKNKVFFSDLPLPYTNKGASYADALKLYTTDAIEDLYELYGKRKVLEALKRVRAHDINQYGNYKPPLSLRTFNSGDKYENILQGMRYYLGKNDEIGFLTSVLWEAEDSACQVCNLAEIQRRREAILKTYKSKELMRSLGEMRSLKTWLVPSDGSFFSEDCKWFEYRGKKMRSYYGGLFEVLRGTPFTSDVSASKARRLTDLLSSEDFWKPMSKDNFFDVICE